jgi:putative effector of murein hydrolase
MDPKKYPRIGGFILFVFGASLSAWFYQSTIERAASKTIRLPFAFAALVACSCLGLALMVFGEQLQAYSRGLRDRKKTIKDFVIIGLFVLPGFIAFYLLSEQLSQLGYR